MSGKGKVRLNDRFYTVLSNIIAILFLIICTFITVISVLLKFEYTTDSFHIANVFAQVGIMIGLLLIVFFSGKLFDRIKKAHKYITVAALIIALVVAGILSFTYVNQLKMEFGADSYYCMVIAEQFYHSDFGAVVPKDSYLSLWPFQCSFIFFLEKVMRITGSTSALMFQRIYCVFWLMLIASGYRILCRHCKDLGFRLLYLAFMVTYFPIMLYIPIVYGNLPGFTFLMIGCMFYYEYNDEKCKKIQKIIYMIMFSISMIVSCAFKSTGLIFVIALIIITVLKQLRKIDVKEIILIVVTAALCMTITTVCQKYYEHYANNTCGDGVPSVSFVAMGLQHNDDYSKWGGWNGYHSELYIRTGYDAKLTSDISKESLKESLSEFAHKPSLIFDFIYKKSRTQWADATHGVCWGIYDAYTEYDVDEKPAFWIDFAMNHKHGLIVEYMDVSETIVYLFIFSFALEQLYGVIKKKKKDPRDLLIMTAFIGGFLFSLLWEAHAGYVYVYMILALPLGLRTIGKCLKKTEAVIKK